MRRCAPTATRRLWFWYLKKGENTGLKSAVWIATETTGKQASLNVHNVTGPRTRIFGKRTAYPVMRPTHRHLY